MFSSRISWKSLEAICRSLATMLESGVDIRRGFELIGNRVRSSRARRALAGVRTRIDRGEEVASAMREQGDAFPPLLIDMIDVAEQSGALPEILLHLADHYENNMRLRQNFLRQIAWPMFQFVAAVFVVALVIMVLGWVAEANPNSDAGDTVFDPFGLGLLGERGALIWLGMVFGTVFAIFLLYQLIVRVFRGKTFLDTVFLNLPVIGRAMRSFALARFSWAYYLTQQTGMPIDQSLEASLRATNNGAFIGAGSIIRREVRNGEPLYDALQASGLFPEEYLETVRIGETSGTVPETLHRLSPQFEDQARRALSTMAAVLGWLVWTLVAVFILYFVFSFVLQYVAMIQDAARGI